MKISNLIAGVALISVGYLIGFYEMKYKMIKVMLEGKLKEEMKENTETE